MPRHSSQSLFLVGAVLVALAVGLFILKRPGKEAGEQPETTSTEKARPERGAGSSRAPASRSPNQGRSARPAPPADPESTADNLSAVEEFVGSYRALTAPEDRISQLMDARMLELQDHSTVYNLLVDEALGSNAQVREVARSALRDYGGPRTAQTLRLLLESNSQLPERSELEELVTFLELPKRDEATP